MSPFASCGHGPQERCQFGGCRARCIARRAAHQTCGRGLSGVVSENRTPADWSDALALVENAEARDSFEHRERVWITYLKALEAYHGFPIYFVTNTDRRPHDILNDCQVEHRLLSFARLKERDFVAMVGCGDMLCDAKQKKTPVLVGVGRGSK
jgi:hypothetical protein